MGAGEREKRGGTAEEGEMKRRLWYGPFFSGPVGTVGLGMGSKTLQSLPVKSLSQMHFTSLLHVWRTHGQAGRQAGRTKLRTISKKKVSSEAVNVLKKKNISNPVIGADASKAGACAAAEVEGGHREAASLQTHHVGAAGRAVLHVAQV